MTTTVKAPPPSKATMKIKPLRKRIIPPAAILGAAALALLVLLPTAQAFANEPLTVSITGDGTALVSSSFEENYGGAFEGSPPIECEYDGTSTSGTCSNLMAKDPFTGTFWEAVQLEVELGPNTKFVEWIVENTQFEQCNGSEVFGRIGCYPVVEPPETGSGEAKVTLVLECETEGGCEPPPPPTPNVKLNIEEGSGTVVSNPAGLECTGTAPHSCEAAVAEGSVTLTASPAPGYLFKSWKKCDSGGVNGRQCTITAGASLKEVGAKFVKVWSLDASKAGSGLGKIQTSPGGILCLYNCAGASADFKEGTVTVKQAAAKHNHFVQWLGDCTGSEPTCSLSMTEDHSVEAEFAPDTQYTLSYSAEGGGQGSVKSKPSGLLCGYTCGSETASFYSGETIEIEVKLNKGTTKLTWTTGAGTCTGSTEAAVSTCTVPMSSAKSLVADFS